MLLFKKNISIDSFAICYHTTEESMKQFARDFFQYWTEKSENGKKERWEKEKTFDISKRFHRWLKNENKNLSYKPN